MSRAQGRLPMRTLGEGEAFGISTGAVVPEGADAVVRVEDTAADGDQVAVRVEVEPGRDIRRVGEDIRSGDSVLRAGAVLGSAELGVLASIGVAEPECTRRPTVAIVSTGDELLAPLSRCAPAAFATRTPLPCPRSHDSPAPRS